MSPPERLREIGMAHSVFDILRKLAAPETPNVCLADIRHIAIFFYTGVALSTVPDVLESLTQDLLRQRKSLLDLSTRNRLLNVPRRTRYTRTVEIVDEVSAEVYRLLSDGKVFSFLAGRKLTEEERADLDPNDVETGGIPQPDEAESVDDRGVAARHSDTRLQTRLTSEGLQKRLFDIWYDARTLEEEQGVNVLYLAIGMLEWYDDEKSEIPRYAPLLLLPVQLDRTNAGERFKLRWRHEPVASNLTLQAKLRGEFSILIEDLAGEDDADLGAYFAHVADAVTSKERWKVLPDAMVLGFFSFSKFLMYRDLDPSNWPAEQTIASSGLIQSLLFEGFPESSGSIGTSSGSIDSFLPAATTHHVLDADSSQAIAIEEAAAGRTLVIKGPPGTGKSQTITNMIAEAVARGKTVLFVAEKLAALDVVHRRLTQSGLGAVALELHSSKANKRTVLDELKRTRELALRQNAPTNDLVTALDSSKVYLNAFADRLHQAIKPCGKTPYQILGHLGASQHGGITIDLPGAADWSGNEIQERERELRGLEVHLQAMGSPAIHPWRGTQSRAMDPGERRHMEQAIRLASVTLDQVLHAVRLANKELEAPAPGDFNAAAASASVVKSFADRPNDLDRQVLADGTWSNKLPELAELIASGERLNAAKLRVAPFLESARDADVSVMRASIESRGTSLLRFFDGNYKRQVAAFASLLREPIPQAHTVRLQLLADLQEFQKAKAEFQKYRAFGPSFGTAWAGEDSDWPRFRTALEWRKRNPVPSAVLAAFARTSEIAQLDTVAATLEVSLSQLVSEVNEVFRILALDIRRAFVRDEFKAVNLEVLQARFTDWLAQLEALPNYQIYRRAIERMTGLGLGPLLDAVDEGKVEGREVISTFHASYADALRRILFSAWPELKEFDGDHHGRLIAEFRQLDKQRMELAKQQIAQVHADGRPKGAVVGNSPIAVLLGEIAKKSRHLSIRQLLEKAGPAIQSLKPVFMMSPLSVAQFLKPGAMSFDILVVDEASQVEPVDALGAIARCRQMVIVGDERQLPPTRFFSKITSNDDGERNEEDESTFEAKDAESVLDLCLAKGVPSRMLTWHYRSRHQSLIAVSNREFYRNELFIVPSPYSEVAGMGLRYHRLPESAYDRGGTRTNPIEARAVAEAVMRHASESPQLSLGVATFSVAQRQQILKELEILRRKNQSTESFFERGSNEPFFVKNLENIQGDERDVIFISVGYGKTETGYLAHGFGPLSSDGGERRLNVLISRAKVRCEVFCNFQGADIDLERTRSRGVAAFKMFLTFAETGHFETGASSGGDFESVFEEAVAERLSALGYEVRSQIGASGFFIDLAIADPDKPGRYILGIECDGAQYHSSRSARDRDRLRQQVLEAQGWIVHRIWSADWYMRPEREIQKLQAAIEAAKAEWHDRDEAGIVASRAVPFTIEADAVEYVEATEASLEPVGFAPYREASFAVNRSVEIHDAPLSVLMEHIVSIVETEGPIHVDEITTRLRSLWGLQRAGNRIRTRVLEAIGACLQRRLIEGDAFYALPGSVCHPRNRASVQSSTLRRLDYLPPAEIDMALLTLMQQSFGAPREELISAAARQLGFGALSSGLREMFLARIDALLLSRRAEERAGMLTPSSPV